MSRRPALAARRVRQTLQYANGASLLFNLASARTPWARSSLTYRLRGGGTVSCPNVAGARVPIYEVFSEDTYRMKETISGLPPSLVALDIGGQVGCFSLALVRAAKRVQVHAYEASPSTAAWLRRNVTDNGFSASITVHATAVSDHEGTISFNDNGQASGLNGLTAPDGTLVEVPCIRFAAAVAAAGGRVDLVKIDTEGAEYDIVLGSSPSDWASVSRVVMEYHDVPGHSWDELHAFFTSCGFTLRRHEPAGPRQGTVWLAR
ncbi:MULTISPECIES: FkbM family methyltransferase [unclassified Nocardioides]|uniref:FkbM family methyltransferase n=1 Tax=unclassified Nocardioides TaxID=2615069 RepID=UPI0006F5373A|nr:MULTISPECIES: FkbM family methyltransferase [unclassified Nocardioides]KQY50149.1 hypothetical protein ASD30_21720 [Nocardioides sp. Root140]KQZ75773.1 hypothetical protein ASD66_05445 [Nocardioides sp. Root151]